MSKPLSITLMMDQAWLPAGDPNLAAIALDGLTERHVAMTLRELGHQVRIVGVGHDVQEIVAALTDTPPDIVFNLTEQFRDDRRLDMHVAGLLELMGLPFTGSGSAGLMLCRDKGLCKQLLSLHKIRCPSFALFPPGRRPRVGRRLKYPLIIKPQYEDASDGIFRASIVGSETELTERVRLVHERYDQVAIAEEYVEGRELYVGVLGNKRLLAFPAREIHFGSATAGGPSIATRRVKSDAAYRDKWGIEYRFADLSDSLAAEVSHVCKRVYRLLQLQDYGRIDLRVTADNRINILEVNANPEIAYGEDFAEAAEKAGVGYGRLIDRILKLALRRHKASPGGQKQAAAE